MGRYARKLIKEVLGNPMVLLEHRKFRKLSVFEEFLKEITKLLYTNGDEAFALARLGPDFAELVASETGEDPNILLIRAYGRLGSAYRVLGNLVEADKAYDEASALPGPASEHADTDRRRAYLRVFQGRPEQGHAFAHSAVEVYKQSDDFFDRHPLGIALIARGFTHYHNHRLGSAAIDLSAAIGIINYRVSPRPYYYALHNLSVILVEVMEPNRLSQVLKNLDASYNRFVGSKRHIAKYKIHWLRALAHKRFGATRQAERLLKKAFNGFVELKASTELSLVSIDIALLLTEEGHFDEARNLARSAY